MYFVQYKMYKTLDIILYVLYILCICINVLVLNCIIHSNPEFKILDQ